MVWVWVWVRYCVLSWWVPGLPPVSSAACCLPGHQQHGIVCPAVSRDNLAHCVPWLSSQATCGTTTTHNPYFSIGLVFCCFGQKSKTNKQTKKFSSWAACGTTTTYNPGWETGSWDQAAVLHSDHCHQKTSSQIKNKDIYLWFIFESWTKSVNLWMQLQMHSCNLNSFVKVAQIVLFYIWWYTDRSVYNMLYIFQGWAKSVWMHPQLHNCTIAQLHNWTPPISFVRVAQIALFTR